LGDEIQEKERIKEIKKVIAILILIGIFLASWQGYNNYQDLKDENQERAERLHEMEIMAREQRAQYDYLVHEYNDLCNGMGELEPLIENMSYYDGGGQIVFYPGEGLYFIVFPPTGNETNGAMVRLFQIDPYFPPDLIHVPELLPVWNETKSGGSA
jgi:cell division protein FtsB